MDKNDRGEYDPMAEEANPITAEPDPTSEEEDEYLNKLVPDDSEQPEDTQQPPPPAPHRGVAADYHKKRNNKPIILTVLAVLIIAAAAAYWFALKPKTATQTVDTGPATSQQTEKVLPAAAKITTKTKLYNSSNFNLAFTHPEDWTVADVSGTGILTLTSPELKLDNGTGQIVMTIRDKAQKLTEFDKGNAVAARDSEKVAYTKPTQTQRGSTYVSYLSYAGSTGLSGFYITGDNGYKKDQAIPQVDIAKVDPVISITFVKAGAKANVALGMLDDSDFQTPLLTMLKSLSIN